MEKMKIEIVKKLLKTFTFFFNDGHWTIVG